MKRRPDGRKRGRVRRPCPNGGSRREREIQRTGEWLAWNTRHHGSMLADCRQTPAQREEATVVRPRMGEGGYSLCFTLRPADMNS